MDPVNVPAKFEVCSFTVPEIIAIAVFVGVANTQSWGREGRRGSGVVRFEKALVSSYRPSIVTFPLSLRVSEILPRLCSSTPLFPTLPLVSPKFPYVPLGVGGYLGYEERRCWVSVRAISFQDFQPMWSWSTNVTDRQTDGRTTCNLNTALCTSASRCKNEWMA